MTRPCHLLLRRFVIVALLFAVAGCDTAGDRQPGVPDSDLADLLGAELAPGYRHATEPRTFRFPQDHAAHPGFRNEWWYLTGNLDGNDGQRYGYELTLFRFALAPGPPATSDSSWATNDVFIGHFAITDVAGGRFFVAEDVARGAAGLAGAHANPVRVWINNWQLRERPAAGNRSSWSVSAATDNLRLELTLEAQKPPVLHGDGGRSQKSADPRNASYYYSLSRLRTVGEIGIDDRRVAVNGLSWLDREWSSSALAADQVGWDWFALQLIDGSELMFYQLRKTDGSIDAFSSGSLIAKDGSRRPLARDEVLLEVLGSWTNTEGSRYPQGWRLRVPSENIDLRVRPVMRDQELRTFVKYWEGAVDVTGTRGAERVAGRGYVELTGYAGGGRRTLRR
jgi:predicted secreted hydrolase